MINLQDIFSALTDFDVTPPDVRVSSVVIDSRQAGENSLFIALPGENVNGHQFVQSAFDNGACLAFIDQDVPECLHVVDLRDGHFDPESLSLPLPMCLRVENTLSALQKLAQFWREKHPLRVIGITGSVGKTSTKELTAQVLAQKYTVLKNPGNRNNEIGLPLTLLELEPQHECAVLEMGFYVPGEIQTLCEIAQPQVGVVTNIGTVHAERAGSQEMIAKGKSELVQSLPPAPEGIAVLNIDDPWVRWMMDKTHASVLTYGIDQQADLSASGIESHGLDGISCNLTYQGEQRWITSPLLGKFSVYTILRATAVALTEGLDWETIQSALSTARVDLRMHQLTLPNGITIIDDTYNASPASTTAALDLLKELSGRRVAILGDMLELGSYERVGHQKVGHAAASSTDILILVGERSKTIAETALENGFSQKCLHWFPDSTQAAQTAAQILQEDDIVLIKGSNSMRMDRILDAIKERA